MGMTAHYQIYVLIPLGIHHILFKATMAQTYNQITSLLLFEDFGISVDLLHSIEQFH